MSATKELPLYVKKTTASDICGKDRRGHNPGPKIDPEKTNNVKEHIKSFPKYISHYSRKSNLNSRYLSADLTLTKMYTLYIEWCNEQQEAPVKFFYYRFIFNTKFNLRFHRPNSDTCSKCDSFQNVIKYSEDVEKVQSAKVQKDVHQRKAEKAVVFKKK